jgi:hypothetical protein
VTENNSWKLLVKSFTGSLYLFASPERCKQESDSNLAKGRFTMSQLGCKCGHIIRDVSDFLPYKGDILRDQDNEEFFSVVSDELALFAAAVAANKRQEWINRHFLQGYPQDVSDDGVISDFINMLDVKLFSGIYECEKCGRLWV